jgi:hypothetical protein
VDSCQVALTACEQVDIELVFLSASKRFHLNQRLSGNSWQACTAKHKNLLASQKDPALLSQLK